MANWMSLIIFYIGFMVGFILMAIFAGQSYEKGYRDAKREEM
jgi:hypothetical protein